MPHLPSKNQAMWWTIGFGVVTVFLLFIPNSGACVAWSVIATLAFGIIWYVRWQDDQKTIRSAPPPTQYAPAATMEPPFSDPRSKRMGPIKQHH